MSEADCIKFDIHIHVFKERNLFMLMSLIMAFPLAPSSGQTFPHFFAPLVRLLESQQKNSWYVFHFDHRSCIVDCNERYSL